MLLWEDGKLDDSKFRFHTEECFVIVSKSRENFFFRTRSNYQRTNDWKVLFYVLQHNFWNTQSNFVLTSKMAAFTVCYRLWKSETVRVNFVSICLPMSVFLAIHVISFCRSFWKRSLCLEVDGKERHPMCYCDWGRIFQGPQCTVSPPHYCSSGCFKGDRVGNLSLKVGLD